MRFSFKLLKAIGQTFHGSGIIKRCGERRKCSLGLILQGRWAATVFLKHDMGSVLNRGIPFPCNKSCFASVESAYSANSFPLLPLALYNAGMKEMERKPQAGAVLISEPFMNDNHFSRCIVWLVQHSDTGSVGFKLNDPSGFVMNELMEDFPTGFEVFEGGPVNADNLFFIHRHPGIARSEEVLPGLYWSGDFDQVKLLAAAGLLLPDEIRLFGGYSGWGAGQLEAEMESGSWLITEGTADLIFGDASQQWAAALRSLEADKHWMIHAPRNIQWN